MNNGDVLWAWVAGVLVLLATLTVLPRSNGLPDPAARQAAQNGSGPRSEVASGAGRRAVDWWEPTGATPRRGRSDQALFDALDHMERVAPEVELIDTEPAVAEQPAKP